jgi:hypothetical protein
MDCQHQWALRSKMFHKIFAHIALIDEEWAGEVKHYLELIPFIINEEENLSLSSVFHDLLKQAEVKEKLTGQKARQFLLFNLIVSSFDIIDSNGHHLLLSSYDASPNGVKNDRIIYDRIAIHIAYLPNEALIRKCKEDFEHGLFPKIMTSKKGTRATEALLSYQGLEGKIDVFEAEQYLAFKVFEITKFDYSRQRPTLNKLICRYNNVCDTGKANPNLKICMNKQEIYAIAAAVDKQK